MNKELFNSKMLDIHEKIQTFIRTLSGFENYTCSIKLDWSTNRTMSRGGMYATGPGVNYAMQVAQKSFNLCVYLEYPSFENDKYIGAFTVGQDNSIYTLYALSCHEQAHAAIAYLDNNNKEKHGPRWKDMYRILRNKFVNSYIRKDFKVDKSANTINMVSTVVNDTEKLERDNLLLNGPRYGIHAKHVGVRFVSGRTTLKVVGWNDKARKNFIILAADNNKKYVAAPNYVIRKLKEAGVY